MTMTLFHSTNPRLSYTGELVVSATAVWFLGGLFLDGWAHNHVPELESFFTPWHAVFYSGYFAMLCALLWATLRGKKKSMTWVEAIPSGYTWPVLGAGIFFVGGIGDMLWHEIFGIEADIEALYSPTHLVLATGMTLMLSGGLLSWWSRPAKERNGSFIEQLPMTLSVAFIFSLLSFMTQYNHPVDIDPAGLQRPREDFYLQALPMTGFIMHFALLMGLTFIVMRRGKPAFGFLTLVFTLHMWAMGMMRENAILWIGAAFTGLIADYMLHKLYPLEKNMPNVRLFAFGVPAVFISYYFAFIIATQGTWWSVHMWTGAVFIGGISGLLTSFIAWPPREE